MKRKLRFFLLIIFFISMLSGVLHLKMQVKPTLYGKIFLKTSYGSKPLSYARVELLEIVVSREKERQGKVLLKTYTASKGNFAFYNIPKGRYHLRILKGKKVLKQIEGEEIIKVRLVEVTDPQISLKLPDITVLL